MQEALLHYIWQFQYFDKEDLITTEGEAIRVFNPGMKNSNAGPDFYSARIRIEDLEWVGNVEIHSNASHWNEHKHDTDAAYENVILHVVWKNDKSIMRKDGTSIPTIELSNRVDEQILIKYTRLLNNPESIPCSSTFHQVNEVFKVAMLDKALMDRLEAKSKVVLHLLENTKHDWEETCYQLLFKNFGFKINTDPFSQLAKALPYKLIQKHGDSVLQIESMLFGQAGFLEQQTGDEYYTILKREYDLLRQKYRLTERKLNLAQWRFLRLRPANFPTIRIAQLAVLLHHQKNIFSKIVTVTDIKTLKKVFSIQQSAYWQIHYQFGKQSKDEISSMGEISIDNLIVNTVIPLLVAYSKTKDEQTYMDRAVDILHQVTAESNAITRQWLDIGLTCKTSFDSQALLELHNNFCLRRRCLECTIGCSLIKPGTR